MLQAVQTLGVRREEIAAGAQALLQPIHHALLGRAVEVDQRVAAEDEIERPPWRRRIEQVQLPELDDTADRLGNPERPGRQIGAPLELTEVPDAPALGCAILAACGAGRFATIKEGCKAMVRRREMIEPDGRRTQLYEREIYPRYVALYDALKSVRDVR